MKSRLGASFSSIFAAKSKPFWFRSKFAFSIGDYHSNRTIAYLRTLMGPQSQGCESVKKRSVHSTADTDDDFSELDRPQTPSVGTVLKLATEKPEPFGKTKHSRKASCGKTSAAQSLRHIVKKANKHDSSLHLKAENRIDSSTSRVTENVIIRICNINTKTNDHAIHSMCMSFGSLEGLLRTVDGDAEVAFSMKKNLNMNNILKKLNQTTMDGHTWSAHLLPKESIDTATANNEDVHMELGLQLSDRIKYLKTQLEMKKTYLEDFAMLHYTIAHLQDHPVPDNKSSDLD